MQIVRPAVVLSVAMCAQQALALTGAELMAANRNFGAGYVFGVVEYRTGVYNEGDNHFQRTRDCLVAGGVNSDVLYDITIARLKRVPSEVPMPAFVSVLNAVNEMCPPK